jgi:plastocyanin
MLFSTTAAADGAVAGRVLLPPPPSAPRMPERYRALSPNVPLEAADAPAAIVYLEAPDGSAPAAVAAPPAGSDSVAQRGLQFRPGLLAVRTGSVVVFPNLDDTYHSVFSYSKTKRFDLGRYRRGEDPASIVFDKPGVVKLFCEIHEHMRGTILVLDTPYFTKTDGNGTFRMEHVPAGRYRLTAWVDEDRVRTAEIEVGDDRVANAELDAR